MSFLCFHNIHEVLRLEYLLIFLFKTESDPNINGKPTNLQSFLKFLGLVDFVGPDFMFTQQRVEQFIPSYPLEIVQHYAVMKRDSDNHSYLGFYSSDHVCFSKLMFKIHLDVPFRLSSYLV